MCRGFGRMMLRLRRRRLRHVARWIDVRPLGRLLRSARRAGSLFGTRHSPALSRAWGISAMAIYILVTLVAALVIYLFYAVIYPEKF